jgi:thiamine biosynthesis lipoprotein
MGTRWSAIAYLSVPVEPAELEAALSQACQRVDGQMSTWKPNSDLMRFNAAPLGEWQDIPDELAHVLALGEAVRERSNGLFDMAVLAPVQDFGFGPSSSAHVLGEDAGAPGKSLELDLARLRARRLASVAFDLSGIAKGFGVDLMARTVEAFGIENYLVSIDGELQAGGCRGDGKPWGVALEAPIIGRREVAARLEVHNASLATSGNYRHRRKVNGHWISHTIDPRTGEPVANDLLAVTVTAPDCAYADAWATALLVAGRQGAQDLSARNELDAILIYEADEGGYAMRGCGRFRGSLRH